MPDELERRVLDAVRRHARDGLLPPAALGVGLDPAEFATLCKAVHSGWADGTDGEISPRVEPPAMLAPLVALLWAHRSADAPWTRLMAGTIGSAAFGARHLWQDLGAQGRAEVSALMQRHFRSLAERNVRNLKWKHHLFNCLGAELGLAELRPPRCDACEEQPLCFPDGPVEVTFRRMHGGASAEEEKAARASGRGLGGSGW